ncbi:MAG TPA: hypothetical protein PLU87_18575 [Sedimentisphaerales bacterium]|nr:hypothetical protein [Sedimentisphaerales bacterium]HRS12964.1 hypothetical protein [Sedimentisphaerales bacterium]HRV49611.1 hypothetical protein [Sedimentisphaerales bacterium]
MKVKSTDTSNRLDSGRGPGTMVRSIRHIVRAVIPAPSVAAGLVCLVLWVGTTSVCPAKESEKKKATSNPEMGKLSQQINDPQAYMRELSARLNSAEGQKLLTRGLSAQGWRPSTPRTTTADPGAAGASAPQAAVTPQTPSSGTATSGLSPAPTPTRFGWSPGDNGSTPAPSRFNRNPGGTDSTGSVAGYGTGATSQVWMSPSDRAMQLDPLSAARQMQEFGTTQPAPAQATTVPQDRIASAANQMSSSALDGTRMLGQEPEPAVDARTWVAPEERTSTSSLNNARLLGTNTQSRRRKEPWEYATPPAPQTPQNQVRPAAPGGMTTPGQNPYATQPTPQPWAAPTGQPWQTPQNQMMQTAPSGTAMPPQNPYAAQTASPPWSAPTSQPWQTPQTPVTQTAPSETAVMPTQNPYAAQTAPPWAAPGATAMPTENPYAAQTAAPPWPSATTPTVTSPNGQAAQGELETIYPAGQSPWPATAQAAAATPPSIPWDSQPGQPAAQDPRATTLYGQAESVPTQPQGDLTQTWLSSKNRAAQTALNEIAGVSKPQSIPTTPAMPVAPTTPATAPAIGPAPGSQAARTVVNGSQARHFYEEKEPAWSLGADLEKYRAHAVQEGSRDSGESLKKALGGIGLAIEDTTNIITLGYASDRAKPFRSNDGKGLFEDPGRVPQQAGTTIGSFADGLYSVADLVTFNALPDAQKDVYLDNNPVVRPLIFTGRTIGGAWKTTEEIGNALTWGYFDNVTGSIGMCIESLIEALKHTGQAVTNLARIPVRLITGNSEGADKALDWVLLVPLEMASNVMQMKGISNMEDYKTAFADKGVIGSILEFGGSTFIVYRAVDEMLDELDNNDNHDGGSSGSSGSGGSGGSTDGGGSTGGGSTGGGVIWWFEEGWPTE